MPFFILKIVEETWEMCILKLLSNAKPQGVGMSVPENESEKKVVPAPAQDAAAQPEKKASTPTQSTHTDQKEAQPTPVPSPAQVAQHSAHTPSAAQVTYTQADVDAAKKFGKAHDGVITISEGGEERTVGQYAEGEEDTALDLLAHRFLDLKARVQMFSQHLESHSIRTREIDQTLASLKKDLEAPQVVGDLTSLRQQLADVETKAAKKKEQIAAWHQKAVEKALKDRTAVVEQAEKIVSELGDQTNWRNTGDQFQQLFAQWQERQRKDAHLDKKTSDELWHRFSAARSEFNHRRRDWAKQRDAAHAQAKAAKEKIIASAEKLKDSTDWAQTSRDFNDLMDQWKAAGRAGRRDDDALWARFRAAADVFFNARQADRTKRDAGEVENLAKKRELLAQAQKLVPVTTEAQAQKARQKLGEIQDEWDKIGYVPRQNMRELEDGMDAVEKQIKSVEDAAWKAKNPQIDARRSSFEDQLTARIAELDQLIASTDDPAKKKAYESEKATKQSWLSAVKK
jgi:hypothetical protein